MSVVAYVDQSADALVATVLGRRVDTTRFDVIEEATLVAGDLRLRAGVIGASHFLTLEAPGGAVSEVLACTSPDALPVAATRSRLRDPRTALIAPVPGFDYELVARRGGWDELREAAEAIRAGARAAHGADRSIGLVATFPACADGRLPRTVVLAHFRDDAHGRRSAHIRTVHSYPNEDTIVLSRSRISPTMDSTRGREP